MVASLVGRAVLGVTHNPVVRKAITETPPGQAVARRFVAGESLDDAVAVARRLNAMGATVSLDHLGEHVTDRALAEAARNDYLRCLDRIRDEGLDANISVKLTQLGLGLDDDLALGSLAALAQRALDVGTTVTIDMEESRYTESTIAAFEKVQPTYGNLGIAVQAYLRRTRSDLDRIIPLGGHVRLCKGAYAEPPEVAYQHKREVDTNFDSLLALLMRAESILPAIATHDEARIALAERLAAERDGPYEFQMLYGVRPRLQQRLIADRHPLRIYVPYGTAWYPYLTRRLAERPANLWFFVRALVSRG